MHAHIVLSLLAGIRTEDGPALHRTHVSLDGGPGVRHVSASGQGVFVMPA